jgi:hypothetical protein
MNDKYITFKRDEFTHWWMQASVGGIAHTIPSPREVEDAVIMRRQDFFASPCLATYASMIALVAKNVSDAEQAKTLLGVADYFQEQSELAAEEGWKLPD